jgi:exonuclease III
MRVRLASWNVNNRLLRDSHVEFLRTLECDVLALQEVAPGFYSALSQTGLFTCHSYSLTLRPPDAGEPKARRLGCAIFARQPLEFSTESILQRLPFPERSLIVELRAPTTAFTVCSFHTPPGASWGELKPRSHRVLVEWLRTQNARCILAIDANAPKTDHPDITKNEWWWEYEPRLLGSSREHCLKDTWRAHLEANPELLRRIQEARPFGPLAVSHMRGRGKQKTECRYDFICVTPDIRVSNVEYLYEESVCAGSDHALVYAELQIVDYSTERKAFP